MRQKNTPYNSFWDLHQGRPVFIDSTEGQAHFFLSHTQSAFRERPEEWLLLCRYAGTISMGDGLYELRQLDRLARYFNNRHFEGMNGYAYPPAAREVEKEIIARTAPDFAEGYDMAPAMRLLARYENSKAAFTQPERNLLLTHAFCLGDHSRVEEIAGLMAAKAFARQRVIEAYCEIESVQLGWIGLDRAGGAGRETAGLRDGPAGLRTALQALRPFRILSKGRSAPGCGSAAKWNAPVSLPFGGRMVPLRLV